MILLAQGALLECKFVVGNVEVSSFSVKVSGGNLVYLEYSRRLVGEY